MGGMGERLMRARRRAKLRQADLAADAGVGIATIRRLEQGAGEPRLATARKLAAALGVRAEWLVFGEEPMVDEREGG